MYEMESRRLRDHAPPLTPDQIERIVRGLVLSELVLVRDSETLEAEAQGGYLD